MPGIYPIADKTTKTVPSISTGTTKLNKLVNNKERRKWGKILIYNNLHCGNIVFARKIRTFAFSTIIVKDRARRNVQKS
jgi:hypothetical protein